MDRKGERYCPAFDEQITASRCGEGRITQISCPLSCPFNPFNPSAAEAFDQVLGRGLAVAARWIERGIGSNEWARRFDAMDRRFHPERDLPLISFETQWAVLDMARSGDAYGALHTQMSAGDLGNMRNDARIVLRKLLESQVLLAEVTEASDALPYYPCRDLFQPEREYLYVDFGDQDPLEKGAILFGRFLAHENCIYVVPGIFVGTPEIRENLLDELEAYLGGEGSEANAALQGLLPEVWNICTSVQDELDGDLEDEYGESAESSGNPDELYAVEMRLACAKSEAVLALREHELFEEEDPPEFGVDPFGETVFGISVTPPSPLRDTDDDEGDELMDEEDAGIKVGTLYIDAERVRITAVNPVELELLKALVRAVVDCGEES